VKFNEPYVWSINETIMEFNYNFESLTYEEARAKVDIDFGMDTAKIITRLQSVS
jgi:hypothetical protein